jgi:KDO2-lipid IV(A) lauroyltransferase
LGFFGRALYILLELFARVLARLPLGVLLAAGRLLGRISFRVLSGRRRIALENIRRCQEAGSLPPDLDAWETARESFVCFSQTVLESLAFLRRGMDHYRGRYSFSGGEHLKEALREKEERGSGLVLLTAHMGDWELSPQALREDYGLRILIVGRDRGNRVLSRLMRDARTLTGNLFVSKDEGAREMLTALRGGGIVGTLFDQAAMVGSEGRQLDFMGRPARTNIGPVKLALKTRSPILPLFAAREGERHQIEFTRPLFPPSAAGDEWINAATQKLNDVLAERILARPGEWLWSHRRWKTPEGG